MSKVLLKPQHEAYNLECSVPTGTQNQKGPKMWIPKSFLSRFQLTNLYMRRKKKKNQFLTMKE